MPATRARTDTKTVLVIDDDWDFTTAVTACRGPHRRSAACPPAPQRIKMGVLTFDVATHIFLP